MYRVLILISVVEISAKFLTGLAIILDGFCADAVCVGGLALRRPWGPWWQIYWSARKFIFALTLLSGTIRRLDGCTTQRR